jgi:hypothetical protein
MEQENYNTYILHYAGTKDVILNKKKLDFAVTENVIPDKQ